MKKILVLCHTSSLGGSSISLGGVLDVLDERGAQIDVVCPPGDGVADFARKGYETYRWKAPLAIWLGKAVYSSGVVSFNLRCVLGLLLLPVKLCLASRLIRKICNDRSIDTIYVNSLILFPIALTLRGLKREREDLRVIWHLREMINPKLFGPIRRKIVRLIGGVADHIIAITKNEAAAFRHHHACHVVHNSVASDWPLVSLSAECEERDFFHIAMASALSPGKGVTDFIEMGRKLIENYPNVRVTCYTTRGSFPLRVDFESYQEDGFRMSQALRDTTEVKLGDRFTWILGERMTSARYQDIDLFVRPDRAGCPWGRDIIEAMWHGLPVVATGSPTGFVRDGVTGLLADTGSIDSLVDQVSKLVENRAMFRQMRYNSLMSAHKLFHPDVHAQAIRRIFFEEI